MWHQLQVVSMEWQTTTVVIGCNAPDTYVPPMMTKTKKRRLNRPCPAGTINAVLETGWINFELFMEYLRYFTEHVKRTKTDPVLLLLDKSHTKNLELIDYARKMELTFFHYLSIRGINCSH